MKSYQFRETGGRELQGVKGYKTPHRIHSTDPHSMGTIAYSLCFKYAHTHLCLCVLNMSTGDMGS